MRTTNDTDEPAKLSARVLVWLAVGAVAIAFGAFFLVASSSSADEQPRPRSVHRPVHIPSKPADPSTPTPDDVPPAATVETEDVTLALDLREDERGPVVYGETNLPSSTELLVTIEDAPTGGKEYARAIKCEVRDGAYRAGPFVAPGHDLAGEYAVTVEMPIATLQPRSVQRVIGKQGANLKGPLAQPSGAYGSHTVVRKVRAVVLGGEAGLRKQRFQRVQLASRARCLANQVEDLGKTLEEADRKSYDSNSWLDFVRSFQEKLRTLKKKCKEFPRSELREPLTAATGNLSRWALERARYGYGSGAGASAELARYRQAFYDEIRDARKALKELQVD